MSLSFPKGCIKVAIMGITGAGKSTFVRLLTNDDNIHIGHDPESETLDVQTACYTDPMTGRHVVLIDTPGFDDSRAGVSDIDVLQKIIDFLQPEHGEPHKLNGLIYLHRISDVRVGGLARKNLRRFKALCGDNDLRHVRVVTTNWDNVKEEDGNTREIALMQGVFKDVLLGGAEIRRHTNTVASARNIMTEFIPLQAFYTQLQKEVASGTSLGNTGAGRIISQELEALRHQHQEDLANLRAELEAAARNRNKELREELGKECRALEKMITRADQDRAMLMMTLGELRAERAFAHREQEVVRMKHAEELAVLREMEQASRTRSEALEKELEQERRTLKGLRAQQAAEHEQIAQLREWAGRASEKMKRTEVDPMRLGSQAEGEVAVQTGQHNMAGEVEALLAQIDANNKERREASEGTSQVAARSSNEDSQKRQQEPDIGGQARRRPVRENQYEPRWTGQNHASTPKWFGGLSSIVGGFAETVGKYGRELGDFLGAAAEAAIEETQRLQRKREDS